MSDTHHHRLPIVGPVILIGIGVLALMQNYGQLPANFWQTIWRLWPLILVLIGVELLIGQLRVHWLLSFLLALLVIAVTIGGVIYLASQSTEENETPVSATEMQRLEQDLQGATAADVTLSFGAGTLRVGSLSTNQIMAGEFLRARGQVQAHVTYSVSGGRGVLRIEVPENQMAPIFSSGRSNEWNVQLNKSIPLNLRIEAGASTNTLDLSDLNLSDLRVQAGVSANTITLPKTGNYSARLSGGLATTTVTVPAGVAARITTSGGLSTISVDQARFPKSGDNLYISPNYETATNKVNLVIEGGLATVTVR